MYDALAAMGPKGRKAVVPLLIESLGKTEPSHRQAVYRLEELRPAVVSEMRKAIQDRSLFIRRNTLLVIRDLSRGKRRPQLVDALPTLVELLKDDDEWVRKYAASAIRDLGEEAHSVIPAVKQLLTDGDATTRGLAEEILKGIDRAEPDDN
jgi:HEAT repeat protein